MKQNKLLSLIAALLVAIMLIPSFAFAAEATPKLEITSEKKAYSEKLTGTLRNSWVDSEIVVKASNVPEGATAQVQWHSSKPSAVGVEGGTFDMKDDNTFDSPEIYLYNVCKDIAIVADLIITDKNNIVKTYYAAASFKVTLELVPEKEISFETPSYTYPESIIEDTSEYRRMYYPVTLDTSNDPTYGVGDIWWKVSDTEFATVSDMGGVNFLKPGNFKLTATTRGSKQSASIEFEVVEDQEEEPVEYIEGAYSRLAFRADTFTVNKADGGIDLNQYQYIKVGYPEDESDFNDSLVWSVSAADDGKVATVDPNGYVTFLTTGKPVITVASAVNSELTATCTLNIVDETTDPAEVVTYDTFKFATSKKTLPLDSAFNAWSLLSVSPRSDTNNIEPVVFTSNNATVATVDPRNGEIQVTDNHNSVGQTATITARTLVSKQTATLEITVVEVPEADPVLFDTFAFTADSYTLYLGGAYDEVNLWDYLNVDPDADPQQTPGIEGVVFVSSDPNVAFVVSSGDESGKVTAMTLSDDPVTITAIATESGKKATIGIIVKDETQRQEPFEEVKFVNEAEGLVLYEARFDDEGNPDELNDYNCANLYDFLTTKGGFRDEIRFVSDDSAVAYIVDGYKVIARKAGTATITAQSVAGDKSATLKVTVKKFEELHVPFDNVKFIVPSYVLYTDWEIDPWEYLDVEGGINDDIVFTSNDSAIAAIEGRYDEQNDQDYIVIKARKAGETTITAKSRYGEKSATLKITVKQEEWPRTQFTKFAFAIPELTMYVGEGDCLRDYMATVPQHWDGTEEVVWVSSDPTVLRVNQQGDGRIEAKKASDTAVTVTATTTESKQTATIKVKVLKEKPVPFTSIDYTISDVTIYEGDEFWLGSFIKLLPANATDGIIWTSNDPSIATVEYNDGYMMTVPASEWRRTEEEQELYERYNDWDYDPVNDEFFRWEGTWGKVTAKKAGTTNIVARSYLNRSLSKSITVTVKAEEYKTFDTIQFVDGGEYAVKKSVGEFDSLAYIDPDPKLDDIDYEHAGLVWTSSDTTIANVDVRSGFVTINKENIKDEKVTVTITVRAFENAKATKSYKLTIINDDEFFKALTFVDSKAYTAKFEKNGTFNALLYLVQDPLPTKQGETFADQIIWTSSDLEVAKVDDKGIVTFKKPGTVKITARSKFNEKVSDTFTLTIDKNDNPITEITLTQDNITLTKESNAQVITKVLEKYLVIKPVDYDDSLIWTSSDPMIVDVDNKGRIVRGEPGTAKLTVRSKKNAVTASFNVTVTKDPLTAIKFINEVPTQLNFGQSIDLKQYLVTEPYYYAKKFAGDLIWACDNPQYAKVSDDGIVEYIAPGATVTIAVCDAEGNAAPASIKLATTDVWVTEIAFTKQAIDMKVGEELPLDNVDFTVTPYNADYKKSTAQWSTSDPDIVAIKRIKADVASNDSSSDSASYKLVAVHEGTATISAHIENAYNEVTGSFTVTVTEHGISSVKFAKSEYTKKIGNDDQNLTLYFTVSPYDIPEKTVKDVLQIESSDRNIVDVKGAVWDYDTSKNMYKVKVRCEAPGSAKVTVSSKDDDKVKGKTKVTVTSVAVKKVKMPKTSMKLFYYYTDEQHEIQQNCYTIKAKVQPSNAWYNTTWETSNAGVAFVKDDLEDARKATIVATGAGTATITMNVDDGKTVRQAKMKITVVTKTVDLKLNKKKATIKMLKGKDNTLQLEAFDDETEYDVPVKWTSSNKKVATVDKNGLVTAKKAGTAVITATTKDGNKTTATCNITVVKKEVTSLTCKDDIVLAKKETKQLKVKVKPSDAYDTSLSYKSSDEKVVTVDSKGLLTAVGAGEATITIKTKDGTKMTLEISVTVK